VTRPQLTIRARLTLLYSGLFAVCGAIVVAVSYILVAQLGAQGQTPKPSPPDKVPASLLAQCRAAKLQSVKPNLARCNATLQQLGAQRQRDLTLSHLLQYSLITLALVIAVAALLGWIFSGRALRPVQ
jgi:hypothetical protein